MRRASWRWCCVVLASGLAGCGGAPTPAEELCLSAQSQAMQRVCQGASTVTGPDVSTYQGAVNWTQVKSAGNAFAIARVSDGLTHLDARFAANWPGMRAAGLVRGVYQFFRPGLDPVAQADLLLTQVQAAGGFDPGDLPPVLDMEVTDNVSTATIRANMQAWLDRIEQVTHKKPLIYTAAFMNSVIGTGFSRYPLWVANYGVTCPMVPDSWSAWVLWQSSSTQTVAGISGACDFDRFDGTLAELKAFAVATVPVAGADAGVKDAGAPAADAGRADAGTSTADAGSAHADAGTSTADAGSAHADAGAPPADAGELDFDAGALDGGAPFGPEGGAMGDGRLVFVRQCARATGP